MIWAGSRSAWIHKDQEPDMNKIVRHRLDTVFIDPRSSNAEFVIALLRSFKITAGVYVVNNWHPTKSGAAFARWTSDQLNRLLPRQPDGTAGPCFLDLETKQTIWAESCIYQYRKHQPRRPTAYTNEPFQGSTEDIDPETGKPRGYVPYPALRAANMPFYVQTYYGDMTSAGAVDAVLEASRYYAGGLVMPLYDGKLIASDQREGCWYTLETLP